MKLLFVTRDVADYGLDVLFDGLCRILGAENVLEYPHKSTLHGGRSTRAYMYPCFFDYPVQCSDDEKRKMLQEGEFDAILLGGGPWYSFVPENQPEFAVLLEQRSKTIPTYLIDQGDHKGLNPKLMARMNIRLCFKREYSGSDQYHENVVPFNFSYPVGYMPKNIYTVRDRDLFWAGKFQHYRRTFLEACNEVVPVEFGDGRIPPDEYRARLLRSRIGLSIRGLGFDTVRYYEVPAHGALLFSQQPKIFIENDFTDGETAVFYSTPEELKDKLRCLLASPDEVALIAGAGYVWMNMFHTNTVRAAQLLDRIGNAS